LDSFHSCLFKGWPLDNQDSGAFRTCFGEALNQLQSKLWLIHIGSHPDFDALDVPPKQDGYVLVLWQQTSTLHQQFFAKYLKWTIVEPGWCLSSFSAIGCFWTSWYFPPKSHLIVIFFSFFEFLVATALLFCFAWLLQYRSSSFAVSNYAEGGDVKSISCLLLMINDLNFLMSIFVGLSFI